MAVEGPEWLCAPSHELCGFWAGTGDFHRACGTPWPHCWSSVWTAPVTWGDGLQTLAFHGHICSQAFDQAVAKDAYLAIGFFQRGVANFQLER